MVLILKSNRNVPNFILLCLNSLANLSSSSRSTFSSAGRSSLPIIVWWLGMSRGDIGRREENEENGDGESDVRGGGEEELWEVVVAVVASDDSEWVKAGINCLTKWLEFSASSDKSCVIDLWSWLIWLLACWPFECDNSLGIVWEMRKFFSCCCKFCCCCWSANWMVWTSNGPRTFGSTWWCFMIGSTWWCFMIGSTWWCFTIGSTWRSPVWFEAASTAATAIWLCQRAFWALSVESWNVVQFLLNTFKAITFTE